MQPVHYFLERFRAQESALAVAMIFDDPLARKVLTAWTTFAKVPTWAAPNDKPPEDERALWTWIWLRSWETLDLESFAMAVGTTPELVEQKLHMLINARLLYPDGTISKLAEGAIRMQVVASMPRRKRR